MIQGGDFVKGGCVSNYETKIEDDKFVANTGLGLMSMSWGLFAKAMRSAHVGDGFRALHAMKDKGKIASSSPCSALKTAYNECFNRWYAEKFLKGQWEKEECMLEWEAYRACVLKRMEDRKLHHLFKIETIMHANDED